MELAAGFEYTEFFQLNRFEFDLNMISCCRRSLLLLSAFPYSGSPQRESLLHKARSTSSPSLAPTISISSLTQSIHLLFDLPLLLLPGIAISIILFPTLPSSLLFRCPYQCNLVIRSWSPSSVVAKVLLVKRS